MTTEHPFSLFSLAGRRALVTGASRGIGAAIAVGLAEAGADVALVARTATGLEDVAAGVRAVGRRAVVLAGDVTVAGQVDEVCRRALDELGGVDILVNNAGGPVFHAPILDVREEGWQRVIDLNLTSAFRFAQRIGRWMVQHGRGSVINVTAPSEKGWPAVAAYAAAKAGLTSLTQTLAAEWGPAGVRVNALAPGWVNTAINGTYVADERLAVLAVSAVPVGRWAEAHDMVGTAVWLASDASRYVTGATIRVDGGFQTGIDRNWLAAMDRAAPPDEGNPASNADRLSPSGAS